MYGRTSLKYLVLVGAINVFANTMSKNEKLRRKLWKTRPSHKLFLRLENRVTWCSTVTHNICDAFYHIAGKQTARQRHIQNVDVSAAFGIVVI